jgi:hypothetical protein
MPSYVTYINHGRGKNIQGVGEKKDIVGLEKFY